MEYEYENENKTAMVIFRDLKIGDVFSQTYNQYNLFMKIGYASEQDTVWLTGSASGNSFCFRPSGEVIPKPNIILKERSF